MLWVLDVGKYQHSSGLFQNGQLDDNWRLSTDRDKTGDEYGLFFRDVFLHSGIKWEKIDGLCISCVVPPLISALDEMARRYFDLEPLFIGPGIKTGMPVRYENPKEVGADRIVNSVAGYDKYGGPLVVVDFGTATTFDVISADGAYLGGAIAPGIMTSTEALFENTAKLPRVELVKPKRIIGRTTVESIQSGIVNGLFRPNRGHTETDRL